VERPKFPAARSRIWRLARRAFLRASHKRATRPVSRVLYRASRGDGHSSRTLVAKRLLRPTRAARLETGLAGLTPPRRPYLVLLPVGFAVPSLLPRTRCALTAPFHPCLGLRLRGRKAVCFLWHYPWGRPRRRLSGTVLPRSPDFPPCPPVTLALAERPSGLLTRVIRGFEAAPSSCSRCRAEALGSAEPTRAGSASPSLAD